MPSRHRQKEEGEAAEESSDDSGEAMPKAKRKTSSASAPVAKEEIVRMRAAERRVLIMEGEERVQ